MSSKCHFGFDVIKFCADMIYMMLFYCSVQHWAADGDTHAELNTHITFCFCCFHYIIFILLLWVLPKMSSLQELYQKQYKVWSSSTELNKDKTTCYDNIIDNS